MPLLQLSLRRTVELIFAVLALLCGCGPGKDQQMDTSSLAVRQNEFVMGQIDAPVTMLIYFDFNCVYCQQLQREIIDSLKRRYVDQGQMKLVYRLLHDPTDENSYAMLAAEAVHCAGEENAYPILNYLLAYPLGVTQLWHQTDELAALGSLEYVPYRQCLVDHKTLRYTQGIVERNYQDQIARTPTIIVNQTKIEGLRSMDYFIETVEAALRRPMEDLEALP